MYFLVIDFCLVSCKFSPDIKWHLTHQQGIHSDVLPVFCNRTYSQVYCKQIYKYSSLMPLILQSHQDYHKDTYNTSTKVANSSQPHKSHISFFQVLEITFRLEELDLVPALVGFHIASMCAWQLQNMMWNVCNAFFSLSTINRSIKMYLAVLYLLLISLSYSDYINLTVVYTCHLKIQGVVAWKFTYDEESSIYIL